MNRIKITELEVTITEDEFIGLLKSGGYIPKDLEVGNNFSVDISNSDSAGGDMVITIDWNYENR